MRAASHFTNTTWLLSTIWQSLSWREKGFNIHLSNSWVVMMICGPTDKKHRNLCILLIKKNFRECFFLTAELTFFYNYFWLSFVLSPYNNGNIDLRFSQTLRRLFLIVWITEPTTNTGQLMTVIAFLFRLGLAKFSDWTIFTAEIRKDRQIALGKK